MAGAAGGSRAPGQGLEASQGKGHRSRSMLLWSSIIQHQQKWILIYIYIYNIYIYIHMYIHIERERCVYSYLYIHINI